MINAEGEQQAAAKLVEAAEVLARQPSAMQLRYFTALNDIANDRTSTIVFMPGISAGEGQDGRHRTDRLRYGGAEAGAR